MNALEKLCTLLKVKHCERTSLLRINNRLCAGILHQSGDRIDAVTINRSVLVHFCLNDPGVQAMDSVCAMPHTASTAHDSL